MTVTDLALHRSNAAAQRGMWTKRERMKAEERYARAKWKRQVVPMGDRFASPEGRECRLAAEAVRDAAVAEREAYLAWERTLIPDGADHGG